MLPLWLGAANAIQSTSKARVHYAARRRGCCVAARGARAAGGDAGPPSAQFLPKKYYNEVRNITGKGRANPACSPDRRSHAGDASSGRTAPPIITAPCAIHGRGLALPSAPLHAPAAQRFGGEAGQLLISVS